MHVVEDMKSYSKNTTMCRRQCILQHFDGIHIQQSITHCCDICTNTYVHVEHDDIMMLLIRLVSFALICPFAVPSIHLTPFCQLLRSHYF